MTSVAATDHLNGLAYRLDEDQRAMLAESTREKRLPLLAQFLRRQENDLLQDVADANHMPVVKEIVLAPNPTQIVPLRLIHEYQCVPVGEGAHDRSRPLELVTLWPPEEGMDDWIFAVCGRHPSWRLAAPNHVVNCITQNFGVGADSLEDSGLDAADASGREVEEAEDENAAIIRFVNEVVTKAIEDRATDIHFEPQKESLQIRYRIDGELVPIRVPDNLINYQGAIISRLKIMAKLNIAEKRRPQDGRIAWRASGNELDIRISSMPTMYGESMSLRLLNQKNQPLSISELGLLDASKQKVLPVLELPHGIVLVTGPTGSGKSTSLTAFLREINTPGRRIITIEDPVEYEVPGVNQISVRHDIGFDFASALRHVLRQDPDVIMVGEIRDRETADIAIRASLTGHLVLSTLHTNDAPGALTRLIDMDIEPFLIASSVELLIAQRLVRRLCPYCREPMEHPEGYIEECLRALGVPVSEHTLKTTTYGPKGCERCRHLGYRGRVGLFEILRVNDQIHELIVKRETAGHIRTVGLKGGMVSLQSAGWDHVTLGNTALNEVMRYANFGEDEWTT